MLRKIIVTIFFSSLLLLAVSWLRSDEFPEEMPLEPGIDAPPRQTAVNREPFSVIANETRYRVQPLYRYEFTGLVVSFRRFHPGFGLHERWNDYINVADVCVVWGANARDIDLNKLDFWNGQFTCNFSTSDRATWERFDQTALANNHLLTSDSRLKDVLDDLRVGDQIRVRGFLAEYGQPGGQTRGTSTTRTDSGNGACETVYLEDIRILGSMDNPWRSLYRLAAAGLLISLALWFLAPPGSLQRR